MVRNEICLEAHNISISIIFTILCPNQHVNRLGLWQNQEKQGRNNHSDVIWQTFKIIYFQVGDLVQENW